MCVSSPSDRDLNLKSIPLTTFEQSHIIMFAAATIQESQCVKVQIANLWLDKHHLQADK
jgi:hypothetical protein